MTQEEKTKHLAKALELAEHGFAKVENFLHLAVQDDPDGLFSQLHAAIDELEKAAPNDAQKGFACDVLCCECERLLSLSDHGPVSYHREAHYKDVEGNVYDFTVKFCREVTSSMRMFAREYRKDGKEYVTACMDLHAYRMGLRRHDVTALEAAYAIGGSAEDEQN